MASSDFLSLDIPTVKSQTPGMGRPRRTVADKALMVCMGKRLKWVREALGKSQEEIAKAIGVTQTAWSLYELGKRWPDQFEAMRMMAKLKISQQYLLAGSLEGVERELAIQLAARHPELAAPTDRAGYRGTAQA